MSGDDPPGDHEPADPRRADSYDHPDGTREVVFHVGDDRVLTVREYPDREAFHRGVVGATDAGEHPGVADLPGVEAFADDSGEEGLGDGPTGDEASGDDADDGSE